MITTEHKFVEALKEGNEQAFKALVLEYQDKVFNTCFGFVKNRDDADDLAQEVFIEVYKSVGSFREDAGLSTWIYKIAVNKSLGHLRKSKRNRTTQWLKKLVGMKDDPMADIPDFDHPGVLVENKERANVLFQAIDKLPESQKTAFTLHKVEGLSYEEIAKIMDRSLPSVESLMHRARTSLKKWLYNYYKDQ